MNSDEPLQLRDFVAETIKDVIDGVATAEEYATTKKAIGNPRPQMMRLPPAQSISFDVAITATKGAKTHGGVVVFAGAFGLGSKGQSERTDESVNPIQISVPVWFPTGEYPGAPMGAS